MGIETATEKTSTNDRRVIRIELGLDDVSRMR